MTITNTITAGATGLAGLLKTAQAGAAVQKTTSAASSASSGSTQDTGTTTQSSTNMMAGNFVQKNRGPSKYVKALDAGYKADRSLGNSMNQLLSSLQSESAYLMSTVHTSSGDASYVVGTLIAKKAEKGVAQVVDTEVTIESKNNLKGIKDDIDKRAQEAISPVDENGNPVKSSEDAKQTAASQVEAKAGDNTGRQVSDSMQTTSTQADASTAQSAQQQTSNAASVADSGATPGATTDTTTSDTGAAINASVAAAIADAGAGTAAGAQLNAASQHLSIIV